MIARYLRDHGPGWGADVAAALGLTLNQWCDAVGLTSGVRYCRWFTFDAPGVLGWTLTEAGLREAFEETT